MSYGSQQEDMYSKIITLHYKNRKFPIKLYDNISRNEILEHIHDMLHIQRHKALLFDDFNGNNVLLGGMILDGSNINVTI